MPPHPSQGGIPTIASYSLANASGFSVDLINYGATVTSIRAPDRHGRLADVVLGFSTPASYLASHPYFGAIAGRVAGRITGARFTLDGREYPLAANDPPNHLHGGRTCFDRRFWSATSVTSSSVRLTYHSPAGEEGYPGAVDAIVTYTVTLDNSLVVETETASDHPTPCSLTQHSYFNLAGQGEGTIEHHELQIQADAFAPTDDYMGFLARRESLVNCSNDFTHPRRLSDAIPHLFNNHGDLYFLPRSGTNTPRQAARLTDPITGRVLTVSTTESCLQLYTGVSLDGTLIGKSGRPYGRHAGLCLECEGYPDGANTPALGDIILLPGHPRRQTTVYAFSTEP